MTTQPSGGFAAHYFDGRTAKRHEVIVTRTADGLRITGPTVGEIAWRHQEVRRDLRMALDEPIRLERGGESPEVLVVADHRFLPAPMSRDGLPLDAATELRRRRRVAWLIAPAVAVIVMLLVAYGVFIPRLAARVAEGLPREWEEQLGQSVTTMFTQNATTCTNPAQAAGLSTLVNTLTADGRGGRYHYTVTVVDDSIVNAFAAPGGQIVIFTGLLRQASSPDELAGVLAHEVQHVVHQHGARAVLRQIPARLMAAALFGNDGMGASVSGMAVTLSSLSYGRKDESQADRDGMRMLQAAHLAPEGMLTFFEKLQTEENREPGEMLKYLSSHPATSDRIAELSAMVDQATYTPVPALSAAEWDAVRNSCR